MRSATPYLLISVAILAASQPAMAVMPRLRMEDLQRMAAAAGGKDNTILDTTQWKSLNQDV
ncbi:MAG: hypothetical protein SGARI_007946, partial [Bacillariaceae sp.]